MALVDCPECGDRISTISPQCPNCGHVFSEEATAIQRDPEVLATPRQPVAPPASAAQPRSQSNWVVGLTVAAVVAVILVVVAAALLLAGSVSTSTPLEASGTVEDASPETTAATATTAMAPTSTTVPTTATTIAITDDGFGLRIGECLANDALDRYIVGDDYTTTPCADPHDYEVYFLYEYAAGPFPGEDEVDTELAAACEDEFEGYVGRDYESSSLNIYRLWPAAGLWESGGRIGECLLFDIDSNPLTGSAYQSGW